MQHSGQVAWAPPKLKPTAIRSPRPTYDRSEQAGHHALTDVFYFNLAEFEIAMPEPIFLLRLGLAAQNSAAWLKWSKNLLLRAKGMLLDDG